MINVTNNILFDDIISDRQNKLEQEIFKTIFYLASHDIANALEHITNARSLAIYCGDSLVISIVNESKDLILARVLTDIANNLLDRLVMF